MLTRHCIICGDAKDNLHSPECDGCLEAKANVMKAAFENKADFWTTQRAIDAELSARRRNVGMAGKSDPRMWREPIDLSAVRERLERTI